jgi:hypothetical protein
VRSIAICKNSNKKKGLMSSDKTQSTFDFTIFHPSPRDNALAGPEVVEWRQRQQAGMR